ncbi:MAG: hypothetical protein PHF84_02740 [bacterium]|nr:hypothetical protein [bacterium]
MKDRIIVSSLLFTIFLFLACEKRATEAGITNIYESSDRKSIYFDTTIKKGLVLVSDKDSVFSILDQTDDKKWVLLQSAPAEAGPGRVETQNILYNVGHGIRIDDPLLGYENCYFTGFSKQGNEDYISFETMDSSGTSMSRSMKLKDLEEKIKK